MAIKYSSPDVLLRRIDKKNRRKLFQTSLNISQGKKKEQEALEKALEKVDDIVLESESREAKRSKRMKRYSDIAGLLAMAAAGPLGLGVLGAGALYAGGRRIGSELGEKRAISLTGGVEKRKGQRRIDDEEAEEILNAIPLVFDKGQKAILSSELSNLDNAFKLQDEKLQSSQTYNMYKDFGTFIALAGVTNPELRNEYMKFRKGGDEGITLSQLLDAGKSVEQGGKFVSPLESLFNQFKDRFPDTFNKVVNNNKTSFSFNIPNTRDLQKQSIKPGVVY
tara:strand:- start:2802 stop:3638 length:837 start_codon:yes stop_codon:yes gene_type:complete